MAIDECRQLGPGGIRPQQPYRAIGSHRHHRPMEQPAAKIAEERRPRVPRTQIQQRLGGDAMEQGQRVTAFQPQHGAERNAGV